VGESLALELEPLGTLKAFPEHVTFPSSFVRPSLSARRIRVDPLPPAADPEWLRAGGRLKDGRRKQEEGKYFASSVLRLPSFSYLLYSSTMSCSCTGRLICSRVGSEAILPVIAPASNDSHSGTPRPFTSSSACWIVG